LANVDHHCPLSWRTRCDGLATRILSRQLHLRAGNWVGFSQHIREPGLLSM